MSTSAGPSRSRGLTVRGWFLLVMAAMAILAVVASVIGTTVLSRTTRASDRLLNTIAPARYQAVELRAALVDQETGVRGYLLTGRDALLDPYRRGLTAERTARARLDALKPEGSSRLDEDLDAIDARVAAWRTSYAEPSIAARAQENGTPPAAGSGTAAFDRIRGALDGLERHLDEEQRGARADLVDARTQRDRAFLMLLGLFVLTCIGLTVLLQFAVVRPLGALRAKAMQVAGGDFERRIDGGGPADLRQVAGAVESMRRRVVAELTTSRESEAALTAQAAELDQQAVELRRSNAELEQFAYVASHDLQEPLRKVASFCQLLEKRYGDVIDDRGRQYIDFAVDGAKRMQVLINDLLSFSRVGRLNDAREHVALDDVLDRALRNLTSAVEETGTEVTRPGPLPAVLGDPTLLTMLWQNLIGNAIKFRRPGSEPRIGITAEPDATGENWEFTVHDDGIGIPPEFAEKVFVIFQRLHHRDAYDGTGIGLALCRKIVEYTGGHIAVDTDGAEGAGGTTIRFTLPALQQADGTDAAAEDPRTTTAKEPA
ncbi:ATP-binding protein [Streptomyces sp. NPDC001941]|uniref:sensor histidine kinase n=1 Tax=Streptomyces sp. NPDC001941 TaxID=3154659 RepID=UPI003331F107